MIKEKFHCYECAGKAFAKNEGCSTCDGKGNPKPKPVVKATKKPSRKRR